MIEITGTPAVIITESPEEISYLVATDSPVEFTFVRNDGIVVSVSNQSGSVALHAPSLNLVTGNIGGVYDKRFNRIIEFKCTSTPSAGLYYSNIIWEARYADDFEGSYIINYSRSMGLYLEARIKHNEAYLPDTYTAQPDDRGAIVLDVGHILQSLCSIEKVGSYTEDVTPETHQSGKFELEYRERYAGDTNDWEEEGNTWYYVMATRSKEQGSNLWEYVQTANQTAKFFNEFDRPKWYIGTPCDLSFWWNPIYSGATITIQELDGANNELDSHTLIGNPIGKGFLNSIRINRSSVQQLTRKYLVTIAFT